MASHEYGETVTDPWVNNPNTLAWVDQTKTNEIGDLCAPEHVQSPTLGGVWVQDLWDNNDAFVDGDSAEGCDAGSVSLVLNPSTYTAPVFTEYEGIYGVAATAPNDIWGVGYCVCNGAYYQTLAEHYNGASWQLVSTPYVSAGTNPVLMSASADSSSDVWAAGNYLNSSTNTYQTLIEHYDGTTWSIVPSPNAGKTTPNSVLYGIAAISATNVWAVGETYSSGYKVDQALIEHYDGTSWSIVMAPTISKNSTYLLAVAAVPNSNQAWAVGGRDVVSGNTGSTYTLVEHYDGTGWSVSPSTSLDQSPSSNVLAGVTAASPTEILVVGNYTSTATPSGTQQPIIGYFDGSQWIFSTANNTNAAENYYLTAVSVDPANNLNVWIAGYTNTVTISTDQPLLLYSSGVGGTFFPCPANGDGNNELTAIAVLGAENVWAVGKFDNYYGYVLTDQYT